MFVSHEVFTAALEPPDYPMTAFSYSLNSSLTVYICSSNPQRRQVPTAVLFIFHWTIYSFKCDSLNVARSGVCNFCILESDHKTGRLQREFLYLQNYFNIFHRLTRYVQHYTVHNWLGYDLRNRYSKACYGSANSSYCHCIHSISIVNYVVHNWGAFRFSFRFTNSFLIWVFSGLWGIVTT